LEEDDKNVQEKNINPLEFNASKRKLLGDGVQESFLNPKPFKVEKMTLPSATKTIVLKKDKNVNSKIIGKKTPKHRFNVI
jgi:hypothetical protein